MIDLKQTKKSNSKEWSPYLAGALVGLLAIASVYLTTVFMGKSVSWEHQLLLFVQQV